jgi:hypothetical protein
MLVIPIDHSVLRRNFEKQYEASMIHSHKRYRRVKRSTYTEAQNWNCCLTATEYRHIHDDHIEDVNMIEICLPYDKLPELLESQRDYLVVRENEERKLRKECPALNTAWEQYQIMLALVKN